MKPSGQIAKTKVFLFRSTKVIKFTFKESYINCII